MVACIATLSDAIITYGVIQIGFPYVWPCDHVSRVAATHLFCWSTSQRRDLPARLHNQASKRKKTQHRKSIVVDTGGIAKIALMGRREQTKKWKCPNSDRHKGSAVASCRGVYHKIASRVDHFGMPIVSQLYVQGKDVEKHASKGEKKRVGERLRSGP